MTVPMSSAATTSRTWTSPVSRSTSTWATQAAQPNAGIGVAAVQVVVEGHAVGIRLEALVDAGRAVRRGRRRRPCRRTAAGRGLDLLAQPPGGLDQQAADDHRRPRRDGRAAVRHEGRVLRRELDVVIGDAERLADELREDRLGPLAHLGRGGQDADPALGGQLDRGHRGELDLARAGEARPRARRGPARCPWRSAPRPVRSADPGRVPEPARRSRASAVLRPQSRELGRLGRSLEDLLAGHAVAQDLAGRGRVAGVVDVAPPDLERREPELLGDPVEVGLGRELGLRRPEPAERAVGRRVGAGRAGPDPDVRAAIRSARVQRATRQDDRRERAVRPAVHDDLDVLGDEPAVEGHAGPVADDRRVALRGGGDVLVAVVDHADRLLGLARQERGVQPDDRGELLLATEPAAGLGLDHAGRLRRRGRDRA